MTILERIHREPAALLAVIAATVPIMLLAGASREAAIAVSGLLVALVGLLRYVVTPAAEVVAQDRPGKPGLIAGKAAGVEPGTPMTASPAW